MFGLRLYKYSTRKITGDWSAVSDVDLTGLYQSAQEKIRIVTKWVAVKGFIDLCCLFQFIRKKLHGETNPRHQMFYKNLVLFNGYFPSN